MPDLTRLLKHPGNRVTVPALMEAFGASMPPLLVAGGERNPYWTLPNWPLFLAEEAKGLGISQKTNSELELEHLIVSATSRLYLDDAVEARYGRDIIELPLRRSLDIIPYLARGFMIETKDTNALDRAFRRANVPWARESLAVSPLDYFSTEHERSGLFFLLMLRDKIDESSDEKFV